MRTYQLVLLIVHTICLIPTCSFTPPESRTAKQTQSLHRMSSIDTDASAPPIPNWRLIPSDATDYSEHLATRPSWSESQYQESLKLYERFTSCSDSYMNSEIMDALNTLDHAFRLYGQHSVVCSFNGGKDAVVILHLVRAAHAHYCNVTRQPPIRPRVVYFDHKDEFPEVLSFLQESVDLYDLDMLAFEKGVKFSDGLKILVDENILPGCNTPFPMGFVLGTRSSDPNANGQDRFAPSSHWMPPFMRVNPVLQWSYGHIWHFLRLFHLPYCQLYDQGYTSLGTTKDTLPCPALAVNTNTKDNGTSSGLPKFWPAYMLRDYSMERAGRVKKEKESSAKLSKKTIPRTESSADTTISDIRLSDPLPQMDTTSSLSGVGQDDSSAFTLNDSEIDKSVGILIIGDEILKGLTIDQNTNAAAKALRKESVTLSRVVVVSDDQEEIVKEIRRLDQEVDVIITSGGVGPTHDDVTIKSVAASLGQDMILHAEMADLLRDKMKNQDNKLTPAQEKMATLPSNAKLRYLSESESDWPILQCRNIFILPGVPEYFSKKIENVAAYLSSQLERSTAYRLVLSVEEASIVDALNEAVIDHPNVSFGSYPFVSHPDYKTVVTLEANVFELKESSLITRNSAVLDKTAVTMSKEARDRNVRFALDDLINKLPEEAVLRVENDDMTPFN